VNLDILAGIFCIWIAVCICGLHVVSSPKRHNWMTIPEYVRRGLFVTAGMFLWRGTDFLTHAGEIGGLGHINAVGIMSSVTLAYTVSAIAFWALRGTLPDSSWSRLQAAQRLTRDNPGTVPVLLTPHHAAEVSRAAGIPTVEAGEGPEAVWREGIRSQPQSQD
jgi:hypothetical protein